MSIGVQVWSGTASSNSTSDSNINWAEGMAPSQVNDSARAEMASVAKWRDDNNGTVATSGTSAAYTVTSNQVAAALTDGYTLAVKFHATNDNAATLAQDGLAAKNIQIVAGTNISSGIILANSIQKLKYDSGSTGWIIQGGNAAQSLGTDNITDSAIIYSKLQTPGASKLLGNPSTSTSTNYREITLGTNLSFSGQTLNAGNNTPVVSVFTSTGSATWSTTTANGSFPLYLLIRMAGGGGGGGAANTNSGSSGTDTSFSNWTAIGAAGGVHGGQGAGGLGGSGGTNGTGTVIRRLGGQAGGLGTATGLAGAGGNSALGGGGQVGTGVSNAIANSGSGGNGGNATGGGGGGAEYVEFLITSPSTSYSYTVGGGGLGGTAGSVAGGNGGAGRVEVISYWQ